jgi:hypothetical protein
MRRSEEFEAINHRRRGVRYAATAPPVRLEGWLSGGETRAPYFEDADSTGRANAVARTKVFGKSHQGISPRL